MSGPPGRVVAGLAIVVLWALAGPPAFAATVSVRPEADTYVSAAFPRTNLGRRAELRIDRDPARRSYLRFDVRLPPRAVVRAATLRLYTPTASAAEGFSVSAVSSTAWREYTTTHLNAPPWAVGSPPAGVGVEQGGEAWSCLMARYAPARTTSA